MTLLGSTLAQYRVTAALGASVKRATPVRG